MDTQTLSTAISSMGFPIVACLGCAWFCYYLIKSNETDRKDERDRHEKEMDSIKETVNGLKQVIEQNTLILTALKEKLEGKL